MIFYIVRQNLMMQDSIFIIFGLLLWGLGANWLLKGAAALSIRYNIPKITVGMTVVSLATALPELLLGVKAIREDLPGLALETAMGSNMANLGLVLALALILLGIGVPKQYYRAQWSVMVLATTLFFGFIYFDGEIQRYEGFFMMVALFLFLVYLLWFHGREEPLAAAGNDGSLPLYGTILSLGLGGLAIWGGSELLLKSVWGHVVPDGMDKMMVSLLSVGVAIPELAFALIAIVKKEGTILLGSLIGSNMFNLLGVLGISARIAPIKVMDPGLLTHDIPWLMGISFALLPLLFFSKGSRLGRKSGLALLLIYLTFIYFSLS